MALGELTEGSTRSLLRYRPFRVLVAGQTLTLLGDLALILVLGIWARQLTGSVSAGGAVFFAMIAPTFLASAALLSSIHVPDIARRRQTSVVDELGGGIRHILRTPILRRLLLALCAAVAVLGLLQVVGLALVDHGLHRPATFLGVIFAVEGAGAIAGGLAAPELMRRT